MFVVITGTIGAGKDTVANHLKEEHDFVFASGSQIISSETKKRGLEVNRENMHKVANDLRANSSAGTVGLTIEKVHKAEKKVIGFLRSKNSVLYIREYEPEAIILGIDAPLEIRYQRTQERNEHKDKMTFDEFKKFEAQEMISGNPDKQNISYCLEHADYTIKNNGSLKDLHQKVDQVLKL